MVLEIVRRGGGKNLKIRPTMWFLRSSAGEGGENPKIRLAPGDAVGEGRFLGIVPCLQRTLRLSLYCLWVCLLVVYCFNNHHIAEGSVYAVHGNRHIGEMQYECSAHAAAANFTDRAGDHGSNHSTVQTDVQGCPFSPCRVNTLQTDDDHCMHCIPSYSSLFARMQGGEKAELQGQGSGMTGAKGKGGERGKVKNKSCKALSGKNNKL